MRTFLIAFWTIPFAFVAPAEQAQPVTAQDVIHKAIKAQGGQDILSRTVASQRLTRGIFHEEDLSKFTGESFSDAHRLKYTLRGTDENRPDVRVMVVNEDGKGWGSYNGNFFNFDDKVVARMRMSAHADKVASLVSLVRDNGYTLTLLGETKVKDTPTIGIKVRYTGRQDITLYFDKKTGLLTKTAYRLNDLENGKDFLQEAYYSRFEWYDPAAEAEKVLRSANLPKVDGTEVFKFLEERTPDKADREKIDLLILELGRTAFSARQKASAALQAMGPKTAAQLRAALASPDREVVERAQQLLDHLAKSEEPKQAAAAVWLLAARRPAGAAEALLAYLPAAVNEAVAKEVQWALAALVEKDDKSRAVVERHLKDADEQRRAAARAVLGLDDGVFLNTPGRRVLIEGVRLPRAAQVFRDGQLYMEIETVQQQFFNRFDESLFARP